LSKFPESESWSLAAIVEIGELRSAEAAALCSRSDQAVLALMVDKAVAVVMEPALSVVTFVIHRMTEEFTSFVVLTNSLTVTATRNMCDVLNLILMLITTQAWPKVSDAWQRSGREVTTLIQIRCWSSRLAVTLVSRWSWMGTFSALMVLYSKALV